MRIYSRVIQDTFEQGGFDGEVRTRALRPHGLRIPLELDDWSDRLAYFCGTYYEIEALLVVDRCLGPGDVFVDVGANIGMLTLAAAHRVGPAGRVLAFEPNPALANRIRHACSLNGITHVSIRETALGDAVGEADLHLSSHPGSASLRSHTSERRLRVPIAIGDDCTSDIPREARVLVKIDVEGYEERVLRGLVRLLRRPRVAALVEVTDAWLRELGSSAESLCRFASDLGYASYRPRGTPFGGLVLEPVAQPLEDVYQYDLLFVRREEAGDWLSNGGRGLRRHDSVR